MGLAKEKVANVLEQGVHLARHYRHRSVGKPLDIIAKEDGVTEVTVRRSVMLIDRYNSLINTESMIRSEARIVMVTSTLQEEAIKSALTAKKIIRDQDGKEIKRLTEPDHEIQLKAVDVVTDKAKAATPKGPGINLNVGVNNSSPGPAIPATVITFEDRVREIQRRRNNEQHQIPAASEATEAEAVELDSRDV